MKYIMEITESKTTTHEFFKDEASMIERMTYLTIDENAELDAHIKVYSVRLIAEINALGKGSE